MKIQKDSKLSDWCFSYNPKILAKDRDVEELVLDLCEREAFYKAKIEECEERTKRSIKIYQGKIKKIQLVLERLCQEEKKKVI